jgi:predicted metalloprotease with PDZ domain
LPLAELLARFGVSLERQPATLAQRLGVRVSESALTGVKVTHVLRGGAGERVGLAAGDELIGVAGWRLRRLDDAFRFLAPAGATPLCVCRDQRLLDLALDIGLLAGEESGAVQLRQSDGASAEARALGEAWTSG